MSNSVSVWLDDDTERILRRLMELEDRTRSGMVRALIRRQSKFLKSKEVDADIVIKDKERPTAT